MQTPDQPSEEIQQASQPLYEFSAGNAGQSAPEIQVGESALQEHFLLPPAPQPEAEGARSEQPPSAEAIRQGLVYPPPPSFYQVTQAKPAQPSVLPPGPMHIPSEYAPPQQQYRPGPPPTGQFFVPIPPPQAPLKRSRRWIWIVVSIFSIALLAACSLCGWGTYSLFSTTMQQLSGSISVVNNYYSAIQAKNYSVAYDYLAPQGTISGLTRDQFTQQAQSIDDQYGPVLTYTPAPPTAANPNSTNGPDLSHLLITVDLSRKSRQYSALLTVQQLDNTWKITDFDSI